MYANILLVHLPDLHLDLARNEYQLNSTKVISITLTYKNH